MNKQKNPSLYSSQKNTLPYILVKNTMVQFYMKSLNESNQTGFSVLSIWARFNLNPIYSDLVFKKKEKKKLY
jgi:hypothetical protein